MTNLRPDEAKWLAEAEAATPEPWPHTKLIAALERLAAERTKVLELSEDWACSPIYNQVKSMANEITELHAEREQLWAEVKRLKMVAAAEYQNVPEIVTRLRQWEAEIVRLRAEVEQLKQREYFKTNEDELARLHQENTALLRDAGGAVGVCQKEIAHLQSLIAAKNAALDEIDKRCSVNKFVGVMNIACQARELK